MIELLLEMLNCFRIQFVIACYFMFVLRAVLVDQTNSWDHLREPSLLFQVCSRLITKLVPDRGQVVSSNDFWLLDIGFDQCYFGLTLAALSNSFP